MRQRGPEPQVSAALGLHLDSWPGAPAAGLRPWWCVAGTQDALRCQYVWSACNSSQQLKFAIQEFKKTFTS